MTKNTELVTAGVAAQKLGVSRKALKLYESHGLIAPPRTMAGWRVYGPKEFEQLAKVLLLKSIGFSLVQIKQILDEGFAMANILYVQKQFLEMQNESTQRALVTIDEASKLLVADDKVPAELLLDLARQSSRITIWQNKDNTFAENYFSKADMTMLHALKTSAAGIEKIEQAWEGLIDDIEAALVETPSSKDLTSLVRRWSDAMAIFTENDPKLQDATHRWIEASFADPDMQLRMPFSKRVWDFMQKHTAEQNKLVT